MVNTGSVFQSTRPRGARHHPLCGFIHCFGFNPRAHGGRDRICCKTIPVNLCFNPRAHGGRDMIRMLSTAAHLCFNPRAHGGRDSGMLMTW